MGWQWKRSQATWTLALSTLGLLLAFHAAAGAENWPRFRGPGGAGISAEVGFPVQWSASDFAWRTELPGVGHGSPCVWQDHVLVTSAVDDGQERLLIDVSASSGEIRWVRRLPYESQRMHKLNSYASATPATDGHRVYVAFSSETQYNLHAFDLEGNEQWKVELGTFAGQHGTGTSPIVFEDLVILANDQDGPSSVVAVEAASGRIRWTTPRSSVKAAYSTPLVVQRDGATPELILTNWGDGIASLDPRTGAENWKANVFEHRAVGSAVYGHGLVFATCGGGGRGKFMAAVRMGGMGLLDESFLAWTRDRTLPYVPTPVVFGDHLYLWGDNGIVSCVAAGTGSEVWTERIGGTFSGSPVCAGGRLYCSDRDGEVVVIAARPEFELKGRSPLGEPSHATPAVSGGRMFFRCFSSLVCLKAE